MSKFCFSLQHMAKQRVQHTKHCSGPKQQIQMVMCLATIPEHFPLS